MAVALRDEVQRMARDIGHAQRPGYYDGMNGEFFFRAAAASRPAAQPQPVSAGVAPPTAPAPTTATAAPPASPGPPPTFSADDISYVTPASRGVIKRVTDSSPNWSLAVHERGGYWWVSHLSGDQAARDAHALASCEFQAGDPCFLYARNRQTVAAASGAQKNVSMLIESGPLNPQLAPNLVPATLGRVESYARTSGSKALAIHPNGSIGISYAEPVAEAQRLALAACNEQAKNQWNRPCLLYAVGNDVVLHRRSANPIR
jgi:hypothetical protein